MRARVAGVEQRRRRLLDDLLVAALQAALALAEMDHVAVRVGEHLHLDVAGRSTKRSRNSVSSPKDAAASRRALRAPRSSVGPLDDAHALAAAAGGRLDEQRVADLVGGRDEVGVGHARAGDAGHDRHAGGGDGLLGADLVAHHLDGVRRRPDEDDARLGARPAKAAFSDRNP